MKKVLGMIVLSGLFVMPYVFAQTGGGEVVVQSKGTTVAVTTNGPSGEKGERHGRYERHPEIERALSKLRAAKEDLEKAAHDFGGHRSAAVGSINHAIEELEAALHYDKR